jgi:hypothetical protein
VGDMLVNQGMAQQIVPFALPMGWSSHIDETSGRNYYVNGNVNPPEGLFILTLLTIKVTWVDPREAPPPSYEATTALHQPASQLASQPVSQLGSQPNNLSANDAPPVIGPNPFGPGPGLDGFPHKGWIACLDVSSGQFFFVDRVPNPPFVTWDDPRTLICETGPNGKAVPIPTERDLNPAPEKKIDDLLAPIKPFEFVKTPYQPPGPKPSTVGPPVGVPPAQKADPFKSALASLSVTTMVGGGGRPQEIRYDDPRYQAYAPPSNNAPTGVTSAGTAATAIMLGGLAPAALGLL